ncbi:uncharacterized protein RHIMIDRAFT_260550 [Rhizopus microsporus ATCC 52813]|uniref:Symplekin/Pta1 N-terminal domain-containing protein n=1 Tax=Rhizopus microsporus ATCC 52813 TaxID=1340429 RepID=A0A2G4SNH3_RHIZD|nr:uncharacterized protein RHIMIDRAFT_260550 [Rhizopus microsporus ATCC 52813]PHZ10338.1 hypothetical protein RHIMIDRAFT_260550 [Rhizopus microsporus ATCC 52813]
MDQSVGRLHEFDQEVLPHPENAASYATRGFLETLTDTVNARLSKEDDGSDTYKEELRILKSAIRAFTIILPFLFKTVCQNEAESKLWELTFTFIQTVRFKLLHHVNTGVKIHAIKCLQVIVLLLSKSSQKDLSLGLIRPNHRILNTQALEKEGQAILEDMLTQLNSTTESVLTATINCLVVTVKRRHQFLKVVMPRLTAWRKTRDQNDSAVLLRNVEKVIKLAFIALIRTESLAAYRNDLMQGFASIGGNLAMFQNNRRDESRRQKRQVHHEEERRIEKKAKLEPYTPMIPPANAPNILANYDITQIPVSAIVNLCMTVLQTVPLEVMTERVAMLPREGVTLAVTRPGFVRSTTPPYPPPPEQPETIHHPRIKREEVKEEIDSDEEMVDVPPLPQPVKIEPIKEEKKPKVEVLASAEERASQALKMQPYELVTSKVDTFNDTEKRELLKMTFERMLKAEHAFKSNLTHKDANSKQVWCTLISKLVTRGINYNNNKSLTKEIKDMLLNFIVESPSSRNELAIAWFKEEYSIEEQDYFTWLHQLLEKTIPTLDAKDRTLTKFLLDAPALDARCVELIKENLHQVPERFVTSISTLRSLVMNKPAVRYDALQVLLDLCVHSNDKMRRTSIVAVKKWNMMDEQEDIDARVEAYSIEALQILKTLSKEKIEAMEVDEANNATEKDDEATNAPEKEEEAANTIEKEVVRHAELYFVLCTKKPSLLKELFSVYIESSEDVQSCIRLHIVNMVKSIGMKSPDLISILRECPEGSGTLVTRILAILCESSKLYNCV